MRKAQKKRERAGSTAQLIGDVCEHMQELRRYYFDIVAADADEVTVRVRRDATKPRPVGFRRE